MIKCIAIDDEPHALRQLAEYIEAVPYLSLEGSFESAFDACNFLHDNAIDLIFVDINMPDINGIDFVKSLSKNVKIVFITAHSEFAYEGFQLDAADYLLKPISFTDFLKSANKVNERYFQQNSSLPEIQHDTTAEDEARGSNIGKLFAHHRMFVFGLFALLCYEIAEISINSYFINFVTGMHWMTDRTASLVLTCALAFFMVGRFLGSWVMRHIKATTMLLICAIGSVVCIGLVLCDLGIVSLAALVGNYLFEAIMFPTIFSIALTGLGNLTKSASSLLMMTPIGGCGFLLMGLIADRTHVVLPFVVPFIGFLVVLAYAVREYKIAKCN
mgnify:CR=1 FL=1